MEFHIKRVMPRTGPSGEFVPGTAPVYTGIGQGAKGAVTQVQAGETPEGQTGERSGRARALPAWLGMAIGAATLLVWTSVAARIVLSFSERGYNWDLDHEMYFGTRLLSGELIWTREFHDKLPFAQILFALPAWIGSVQAWRAIALVLCLAAAASLIRQTPRAFDMGRLSGRERGWVTAFGAGMFLAFTLVLPGGISVLNPAATALAMIAVLTILSDLRRPGQGGGAALLAGALAAAAAISLRPYFLAPLALAVLWGALRPVLAQGARRRILPIAVFRALVWTGWIGLWGMILNVLPYLLTGQFGAVRLGLAALASDLYGREPWLIFRRMVANWDLFPSVMWVAFCAIAAAFVLTARPRAKTVPAVLFVYASVLTLFGLTVSQRWWDHYTQLFSGYFGLLMIVIGAWLSEARHWPRTGTPLRALAAIGALVLGIGMAVSTIRDIRAATPHEDDGRGAILTSFQEYRARTGRQDVPFLAPAQVFLHWQLNEPRHGFPHSANTGHVLRGWWRDLPERSWVAMPPDPQAYCDLMRDKGPAMIVLTRFEQFVPCLEGGGSPYRLDATLPLPGRWPMRIYLRS